jgi:hypothetical protein
VNKRKRKKYNAVLIFYFIIMLFLSITLAWSKPRNDGGTPVIGYVLEKKEKGIDKWE